MLESFPGLVLFEQERCQLIVSIGVAGIEAQGFLVERGGFVFAAAGQIVICEIVQQSWTPTQTQGLKVNCFRLGILLLAVQSGGEQGQSQGVVRMPRKRLARQSLGFRHVSRRKSPCGGLKALLSLGGGCMDCPRLQHQAAKDLEQGTLRRSPVKEAHDSLA